MFRTVLVRNENLLKSSLQKVAKTNAIRCLSTQTLRKYQPQR